MAEELAGPLSYSAVWVWLLVGLTVLPVLIGATRQFGPELVRWLRSRRHRLTARQQCLARITEIESSHAAGVLTGRRAHLELSRAVRDFVRVHSGDRIDTMTLQDLTQTEPDAAGASVELIEAVRAFYDGAFRDHPTTQLELAADSARRAVLACN